MSSSDANDQSHLGKVPKIFRVHLVMSSFGFVSLNDPDQNTSNMIFTTECLQNVCNHTEIEIQRNHMQ